jgi:hypothetical protein
VGVFLKTSKPYINKQSKYSMEFIMQKIKLGKYRHFKGGEYEVVGVARHSESLDVMVI